MSFSSRLKEKEKEGIKESRDYRTRGSYAEKTEGAFSKRIAQQYTENTTAGKKYFFRNIKTGDIKN